MKFRGDGASATLFCDGPDWDGRTCAAIGAFRSKTVQAGQSLLAQVLDWARTNHIRRLIGPMDGDTWHSYRFVTESDGSPSFLLEPENPGYSPDIFLDAGFRQIAGYFSARVQLGSDASIIPALDPAADFRIETWDGQDPEGLFTQVHKLSLQAFRHNAFYRPISRQDFMAIYLPMVPMIRKELIFFARNPDDSLAGFLFGIPNYAEGPRPQSSVLKTYASLTRGAGRHLAHAFHQASVDLGYHHAIHALIHDDNLSALRSAAEGASIFRRYGLFGLDLDG